MTYGESKAIRFSVSSDEFEESILQTAENYYLEERQRDFIFGYYTFNSYIRYIKGIAESRNFYESGFFGSAAYRMGGPNIDDSNIAGFLVYFIKKLRRYLRVKQTRE